MFGAETDGVGEVVVTTNSTDETRLEVRGTSGDARVEFVDSIQKSGTGRVVVSKLRVVHDVGNSATPTVPALSVDEVSFARIDGNIASSVTVAGNIFDTRIFGNVRAPITVTNNGQLDLIVTGDIGQETSLVTINVTGDVLQMTARAIHAHTTVSGAVQTFQAIGDSANSNISGSLTADRLAVIAGGTGGLLSQGYIAAPITINGDVSIPVAATFLGGNFTIHGDLTGSIHLYDSAQSSFGDLIINGSLIPVSGVADSGSIRFAAPSVGLIQIDGDIGACRLGAAVSTIAHRASDRIFRPAPECTRRFRCQHTFCWPARSSSCFSM